MPSIDQLDVVAQLASMPEPKRRAAIILSYLRTGIKNDDDLKKLIKFGFGLNPLDNHICKDHHDPFTAISDLFFERADRMFLWANRSGGKSCIFGLSMFLDSIFKPGCQTRLFGGVKEQADGCRDEMLKIINDAKMFDYFCKTSSKNKVKFNNNSNVFIHSASPRQARGPHPQKLKLDEIEEMSFDVFNAALSQPRSSADIRSSIVMGSTYHKSGGMVKYVLDEMVSTGGYKCYRWCAIDILEPCPPKYKDVCDYMEKEFKTPGYEIMKNARGFYKWEDWAHMLKTLPRETIEVEWLCKKPGTSNRIFTNYDDEVAAAEDLGIPDQQTWISVDFGFVHPYVVLALQKQGEEFRVIDEIYCIDKYDDEVINEVRKKSWFRNGMTGYFDSSEPSKIKKWADAGFLTFPATTDLEQSIEYVNGLLRPAIGKPRLRISSRCKNLRNDLIRHKRLANGLPEDTYANGPDALRYGLTMGGMEGTEFYFKVLEKKHRFKPQVMDSPLIRIANKRFNTSKYNPLNINRNFGGNSDMDY